MNDALAASLMGVPAYSQRLRDEKHKSQIYEVTGPTLLTFREAILEIGKATNRKIDFRQVSMGDYVMLLSEAEVPQEYVALLMKRCDRTVFSLMLM